MLTETETLTSQEESSFGSEIGAQDGMDQLAPGMQALEDWYEAEFKIRMAKLPGLLRTQVDELRSRLNAEFQAGVETVRSQFEERIHLKFMQWNSERESLKAEIEALQLRYNADTLVQETTMTESAIEECNQELNRMIDDPTAEIAILMRTKAKQTELRAYMKGLQFQFKK